MTCNIKVKADIIKLKELIKEEKESAREYRKLGFTSLANDEIKHAKKLKKILTILIKRKYVKKS